jgi:hypothetical protein
LNAETRACAWSTKRVHPEDLRTCALTGLSVWFGYAVGNETPRLQVLSELLGGLRRNSDYSDAWELVAQKASAVIGRGKCKVEAAVLSPDSQRLAVSLEVKTLLGFKVHHGGIVYSIPDNAVLGRIVQGKRSPHGWTPM